MLVEKDRVVTFHYNLREEGGAELENNTDSVPMAYLHGHKNILTGLERALEGLESGAKKVVTLKPEDAYGPQKENATQRVPIKHLVGKFKRLMPGMFVKVNTEKGIVNGKIIKAGKFNVDLDLNHPFAGKTLVFNITITDIREATTEEITHGHAHGEDGHHH